MKLSVIIPCYNEKATIEALLQKVKSAPFPYEKEIIVVDDGSTDGTRDLLQTRWKHLIDHLIFHPTNRGKGGALSTGFAKASGELLIIQDADLEYDPNEYSVLTAPILNGHADVVYGSRFLTSGPHRVL